MWSYTICFPQFCTKNCELFVENGKVLESAEWDKFLDGPSLNERIAWRNALKFPSISLYLQWLFPCQNLAFLNSMPEIQNINLTNPSRARLAYKVEKWLESAKRIAWRDSKVMKLSHSQCYLMDDFREVLNCRFLIVISLTLMQTDTNR